MERGGVDGERKNKIRIDQQRRQNFVFHFKMKGQKKGIERGGEERGLMDRGRGGKRED